MNSESFTFDKNSIKQIDGIGKICLAQYFEQVKYEYINCKAADKDSKDVLIIGLYESHFFIDEEIAVSKYWIDHYNDN